jgi:ketosteroid isomerase-like protein
MSQERLIRAAYSAWGGDDLDALLETLDPEVEFRPSGVFPDFEPIYRGHDGMRNFWDAMNAPWESFRVHVERIVAGEDCAAVGIRFRARGRGSGAMTDLQQAQAIRFRNGRIVKISAYTSFEQALDAVGLRD